MHLVLCNGAWTVKDEAIIHRNEIPCGRVWQIVDELTARGMRPAIEAGDCFYTDPERPADNRRDYVPIGSYPGIDACKVLARVPGGVDRQAVAAFLPDGLDCVVTDGGTLLQVSSVTCSKATACSTLFDAEGVDLADTYAFGDDYNDIPLFSKVGTAIAMGNAPAEVRQAAHLVTSSNDEDGVSEGIETHVLASPRAEGA